MLDNAWAFIDILVDEQKSLLSAQCAAAAPLAGQNNISLFPRFITQWRSSEWKGHLLHHLRNLWQFVEFFLPANLTTDYNCLPVFPDFVSELTTSHVSSHRLGLGNPQLWTVFRAGQHKEGWLSQPASYGMAVAGKFTVYISGDIPIPHIWCS